MMLSESTLQIDLGDGSEPIEADEAAVRLFSSCARGLPDNESTWRIGGLLWDGNKTFSRETVVAWINLVYNQAQGCAFDKDSTFSSDVVTAAQGNAPAVTAEQLYQLLAFADAVGSSSSILQAAMAHATNLKALVEVGGRTVGMNMSGVSYTLQTVGSSESHVYVLSDNKAVATVTGPDVLRVIQGQVASQLEQLLYMAAKLQLKLLLGKVEAFLYVNSGMHLGMNSSRCFHSILPDSFAEIVLSERVLGVTCTDQAAKRAWMNSKLQQKFSFVPGKAAVVLKPSSIKPQPMSFKAVLQQDFLGTKAGEEVDVTLDLMNKSALSVTHKSVGTRELPVSISIVAGCMDTADA